MRLYQGESVVDVKASVLILLCVCVCGGGGGGGEGLIGTCTQASVHRGECVGGGGGGGGEGDCENSY